MSDIAIRVEKLSKKYRLHHMQPKGRGLRHVLEDTVNGPLQALTNWAKQKNGGNVEASATAPQEDEDFWALKDVSFEVKRGEVLGIIGRNGSGKSTLLKLLSRITEPTTGRIEIDGRIASLLEVGTGFHQELTGRENIFLNGAILGMTRTEIRSRFDEIVDFSGVEKFLDTPVKRYSSGMYVRLAFAVAAHLEPEILIIDEVLAVGDAEFQKKCLGRMKDVASGGKTVLFVSHNLPSITTLCDAGLLLQSGMVASRGAIESVVSDYLTAGTDALGSSRRTGSGEYRFRFVRCEPETSAPQGIRSFAFEFQKMRDNVTTRPFVIIEILDEVESIVARCDTRLTNDFLAGDSGSGSIILRSPWLRPGLYSINAYIDSGHGFIDAWIGAARFHVDAHLPYCSAISPDAYKNAPVLSDFSSQITLQTVPAGLIASQAN